ncbi:group II intron reverse transcriptase domain-containing protein [Candidatus Nomurabacteria bacterium]|nr:group II intron reverse transcriptase domain-containing protein [Candidatus Nomurabacteria bacterium]
MDKINFENIISVENLLLAWKEFQRGKRNKKDVQEFQLHLMDNILSLHRDLKNKTYKHGGYYAFNISDPKPRNIHKTTVRDRLLHHAIYRILYSYFDKKFIHDSYSCRINKGTHKATNRFRDFSRKVSKNNTRTCWILKCDIRKFFANIDHNILKEILSKGIFDTNILWLLNRVIDSFSSMSTNPAIAENVDKGLPLGNLTSQLLVNIYMNEFDQFVKRELKVKYYIRYADDFVILSDNKKYLNIVLEKMKEFLKNKLKLQMHPGKVFIKTLASGVDFLGWVNFSKHRILRTTTKRRMLKNLKQNPKEETKQSYLGMLSHGNTRKLKRKIVNNIYAKK